MTPFPLLLAKIASEQFIWPRAQYYARQLQQPIRGQWYRCRL